MIHGHDDRITCNASDNSSFAALLEARLSRREALKASLGMAALGVAESVLPGCAGPQGATRSAAARPGFKAVPVSTADAVVVPPGYSAKVLYAWGDPISDAPAFKPDASNSAAEQALQAGMHHDGMHFFPLPGGDDGSRHGLLAINHEYSDDGLLHADGMATWTADKVKKAQAAHGVSVIEVREEGGSWRVLRPSRYARRITAATPMKFSGPAAGSALLRTAADPAGLNPLGTLNNCANGVTPWGTYLSCEENWNAYFVNRSGAIPPEQARYGVTDKGFGYRWHDFDARFDAQANPNETHRFGWVVEIDPFDPSSVPVKRTALGRIKHESAALSIARDNRVVFYLGDDERFEYIYKFVSRDAWNAAERAANRAILDNGTLYVARFAADGTGTWLALVHGDNGLTPANGFADQAEVLVKTRQAADRAGATKMDRPEWVAVNAGSREVYCSLTNNSQRAASGDKGVDAANPRANNVYGHIIRWREAGDDPAATSFRWDIFVQAGDPANPDAAKRGDIQGDAFGSPDGLWVDRNGLLWIQTDVSTSVLNKGDYANIGNNQMLVADPATKEIRRFLTGPNGCEITGITATPDLRTLFVNIQHPGETASERSDPTKPKAVSSWPDGAAGGRPRSATLVIRRDDGGVIGT